MIVRFGNDVMVWSQLIPCAKTASKWAIRYCFLPNLMRKQISKCEDLCIDMCMK